MIEFLFFIGLFGFIFTFIKLAIKAAWSSGKIAFFVIALPAILIWIMIEGFMMVAFVLMLASLVFTILTNTVFYN